MTASEHVGWPAVFLLLVSKLVSYTILRWVFSFSSFLSDSTGIPRSQYLLGLAMGDLTGLLAVFQFSDHFGAKRMFIASAFVVSMSQFIAASDPSFAALIVSRIVLGLGLNIYNPSGQTYITHNFEGPVIGRVTGVAEMSWALSDLVGAVLMGVMISHTGWREPFIALGCVAAGMAVALVFLLPHGSRAHYPEEDMSVAQILRATLAMIGRLMTKRNAWLTMAVMGLANVSNNLVFSSYGEWLKDVHGQSAAQVGYWTLGIGAAELVGSSATGYTSRFEVRKVIGAASAGVCVSFVIAAFLEGNKGYGLHATMALILVAFVCYEIIIVSGFSLASQIVTEGQGTIQGLVASAMFLGRTIGTLVNDPLRDKSKNSMGFGANCLAASSFITLGALMLIKIVLIPHKSDSEGALQLPPPATSPSATSEPAQPPTPPSPSPSPEAAQVEAPQKVPPPRPPRDPLPAIPALVKAE
jgi:DHA1 family inner membrane transport protein